MITRIYKKLQEYSLIIIALLLAWFSRYPARAVDETAFPIDAGAFQIPLLGIYKFCVLISFTWIVLRVLFPDIVTFFKTRFSDYFKKLVIWEQVKTALLVYFAVLFALTLLSIF